MKEKPTINDTSNALSALKYADAESGRQVSANAKVLILGQELIKNRPEVID